MTNGGKQTRRVRFKRSYQSLKGFSSFRVNQLSSSIDGREKAGTTPVLAALGLGFMALALWALRGAMREGRVDGPGEPG